MKTSTRPSSLIQIRSGIPNSGNPGGIDGSGAASPCVITHRKTRLPALITGLVAACLLAACSDSRTTVGTGGGGDPVAPDAAVRKLTVLDNSEAFYSELRQALIGQRGSASGSNGVDFELSVPAESAAPPVSPTLSPDVSDSDVAGADGVSSSSVASPSTGVNDERLEVTATNVQETGVDEEDRVKVSRNGKTLYVLQSQYQNVEFVDLPPALGPDVVASPPVALPPDGQTEIASTQPAPQRSSSALRILALDAESPDARPVKEVALDLGGGRADGMYLYEGVDSSSMLLTSSGGGYWQNWGNPYYFNESSVITRVNVSDADTAAVDGSFHIDGTIISSRRIGKHLFFVSRYYPALPGPQPYELSPADWQQKVATADLSALLPQYRQDSTGIDTPLVNPGSCFVAEKPENESYYSPDIVTLGVIDIESMTLTDSECYLGATETLYASPDAVYLATTRWDYPNYPIPVDAVPLDSGVDAAVATQPVPDDEDVAGAALDGDVFYQDPRVDTDIHQFDIEGDSGQLSYRGSGTVRGHLGWNPLRKPFRMSAKDGFLRVATINDQQRGDKSPIFVSVLQPDDNGNLVRIAELPNARRPDFIGKPGEQLYASRFLGNRAYLVTFRQTDPLYVVKLDNPSDPEVAGELEIAGYSDYLHPIDQDYLLGIGKDAVAVNNGRGDGRGGLHQGVKLSLFNVADPANPTEVQSVIVGQRGTDSIALSNHRAITIQAATDQHPTRVSFGIDVHGKPEVEGSPGLDTAANYYQWNYTGLHGFDIRAGADAGIERRGALVAESAVTGNSFRYGPSRGDDRAVMINDSVFYIHGPDVYSANWNNLQGGTGPR